MLNGLSSIHALNKLQIFSSSLRNVQLYHSFIRSFSSAESSVNSLKILSAAQSIPHPEKQRGEDAFFFSGYYFFMISN